jgi:uncharacterized protein YdeI (YjbR/CyaY-like superfamily)
MTDIPEDFSDALKTAGLEDFFAICTDAHRREYLQWIAEAKRPETRKQRIQKAVKMLADKCAERTSRDRGK